MSKFHVQVEWSGYSRGVSLYEVEADDPEDAEDIARSGGGNLISCDVVRSDIENDEASIV